MASAAHDTHLYDRFFASTPALLRGSEVLSEKALYARFFDADAANQALMAPPIEAPAPTTDAAAPQPVSEPDAKPHVQPRTQPEEAKPSVEETPEPVSFFARVKQGLTRTRAGFSDGLASLLLGKKTIDDDLLEEIETQLLVADVGVEATAKILGALTERLHRKELNDYDALYEALQEELANIVKPADSGGGLVIDTSKKPYV